ncbi:Antitoxin (plasmid) [Cupriavidus sp. H19C3]|uniref:type II toxin-antitoxin system Phd/YefM family antitoxin n=1 Tax=unclassified Cupriavidus TaxID=2640874 RepID=UPI003BF841D7
MRTVHYSDARNNLKAVIDQAIADHDGVLITRRDAPNAVIMSQEQYDGWMETMHLLSSPANAKHLMESIEQLRRGEAVERQLIDPGKA